jgi:flagellar protein FliO/FliZ
MTRNFTLFAVLILFTVQTVYSQAPDAAEEAVTEESLIIIDDVAPSGENNLVFRNANGPSVFTVIKILFVLIVIALAIYGVIYFIKKSRTTEEKQDSYLKLLSAIPINPRTAVAVVSVGGKAWLVGVSDSSVSLISEIDDKEAIDAMILEHEKRTPDLQGGKIQSFLSTLQRFIPPQVSKPKNNQADNLLKNRDRLRKL